jgi:quercetin dioxygenase-like cupin family protein
VFKPIFAATGVEKPMQKIHSDDRRVVNIYSDDFKPFNRAAGPSAHESALQINSHDKLGVGFHVYRMQPGTTTTPHEHTQDEEFLVLEGELTDNDGYVYQTGDLVWLKKGTQHSSHSEHGALLAVYIATAEKNLT